MNTTGFPSPSTGNPVVQVREGSQVSADTILNSKRPLGDWALKLFTDTLPLSTVCTENRARKPLIAQCRGPSFILRLKRNLSATGCLFCLDTKTLDCNSVSWCMTDMAIVLDSKNNFRVRHYRKLTLRSLSRVIITKKNQKNTIPITMRHSDDLKFYVL